MVDPGLLDHVLVTTSMGPPLKAAENSQPQHRIRPGIDTSMGPPLKAAEN